MSTALALDPLDEFIQLETSINDAAALQLTFERDLYKNSLYEFLKAAWHLVEPGTSYVDNWHVKVICDLAQEAILNPAAEKRYVINVPPGTLKSIIFSVMLNAWEWTRNPKRRYFTASYSGDLALRDSVRVRNVVESTWYKERFGDVVLSEDQNAKGRFNTDQRGWRIASSVRGKGTGEHPNVIVIDDPTSAMQANSAADRNGANQWFDQTLTTRGVAGGVVIFVIMQRLHMEDLSGYLLNKGGYVHVYLPMEFEPERPATQDDPGYKPCVFDKRTTAGELLFPNLFTLEKVTQMKKDLGEYGAAGQLGQRPSPEGGGLFKRLDFQFADAKPKLARRVRGWDTAATEGGGDYTVGTLVSEEFESVVEMGRRVVRSTGRIFIESVVRGQWGPDNVDKTMKSVAESDGKKIPIREEREGGASGKSTIAARRKLLLGWDYEEVNLGVNKIERAKPFRSQVEGHNVYLVRGEWNEPFLQEITNFPTASHDDQVDATTAAFNTMVLEPPPRVVRSTW